MIRFSKRNGTHEVRYHVDLDGLALDGSHGERAGLQRWMVFLDVFLAGGGAGRSTSTSSLVSQCRGRRRPLRRLRRLTRRRRCCA